MPKLNEGKFKPFFYSITKHRSHKNRAHVKTVYRLSFGKVLSIFAPWDKLVWD